MKGSDRKGGGQGLQLTFAVEGLRQLRDVMIEFVQLRLQIARLVRFAVVVAVQIAPRRRRRVSGGCGRVVPVAVRAFAIRRPRIPRRVFAVGQTRKKNTSFEHGSLSLSRSCFSPPERLISARFLTLVTS